MTDRSVLVVEDEAIVALDLQYRLERMGLRVVAVAGSDEELVPLARRLRPDLIILDTEPHRGRDGVAAALHLRAHLAVPIILLTAYADDTMRARAQTEGSMAIVTKPFDADDLHHVILAMFEARGQNR